MTELGETIERVRDSVVAVMRLREVRRSKTGGRHGKKPDETIEYTVSFGSGFCVLDDRYVVTAFHVLNDGAPPQPNDHHYIFTVPANGDFAYMFPVIDIPVQHQEPDVAVLEIGPCVTPGIHVPAMPVSLRPPEDGQPVLTVGFPAPEVHGLSFDPHGTFVGGQFFLKSHANRGIVAAHYRLVDLPMYELNVAWHHGESGGPIIALGEAPAAFSLMQQYRNVQTPHGTVPGPHRGVALSAVAEDLARLGVNVGSAV